MEIPTGSARLDQSSPPPPPATGQRIGALVEVLLCSSVPTQIAISSLLVLSGWDARTPDGAFSLSFVLALSLADTALLILLMVWLTHAHGERVRDLWLGPRRPAKEILLGIGLVPVVFLMVVVVLNTLRLFWPSLRNVPTNPLEQLATGGAANALLFGLVAVLAGGLREELQRAFLLQRFERHLGGADFGVIVLSAAFGLGHFEQGWDAVIATGVLGFFWALVYLWRRSTVAPIVSHAGFNTLEVLRVAVTGG